MSSYLRKQNYEKLRCTYLYFTTCILLVLGFIGNSKGFQLKSSFILILIYCLCPGYYVILHELNDEYVTGVDTASAAKRLSWLSSTSSTISARIPATTFTATLDQFAGGSLSPSQYYTLGVLSCLDCTVTDFSALIADDTLDATTQTLSKI